MVEDMVLVEIHGIAWDPVSKNPIIVLRDPETGHQLPIWIGLMEAAAITSAVEKVVPPRPMTHDLLRSTIEALGAEVADVAVTELREKTFYAVVTLRSAAGEVQIDARPSDSIALAVRTGAPIYVAREVLVRNRMEAEEAGADGPAPSVDLAEMDAEELSEYLESLPLKDFGKYKM